MSGKKPIGRGRIKQLTSGVNPLVRFIHEHNEMTYRDLAKRSGLHATTIQRWRNAGMEPSLGDIEAVLNTMGYDLVPMRRAERKSSWMNWYGDNNYPTREQADDSAQKHRTHVLEIITKDGKPVDVKIHEARK